MHYVYILRSSIDGSFYYGSTINLQKRLKQHNDGQTASTKHARPWTVVWYGAFAEKQMAEDFERYLKTASGKAFLRKRLI